MNLAEYKQQIEATKTGSNFLKRHKIDADMMQTVLSKLGRAVGDQDSILGGADFFWLVVPQHEVPKIVNLGFVHPNGEKITKPQIEGKNGGKAQFNIERNTENLKICFELLEKFENEEYELTLKNIKVMEDKIKQISKELAIAKRNLYEYVKNLPEAEKDRYLNDTEKYLFM